MTSIHQRLPDELLQMIINMVDDRPTLHTLLTVSKTVFDVSVKKLWEAPFHFEWNPNFIRLFTYVFAISPCCRPDIVALREELGIQKLSSAPREGTVPEAREEAAPYIDYLALVRHVDLDIDYASLQISDDTFTLIEQALPWIICNGQFGQFVSVSLSCVNVEALIDAIPTMTRLTRIKWVGITDIQEFAKSVRPFVEAFVDAHGERGRQIDLAIGLDRRFPYLKEQDEMDQILVDISRLLGPLPSSKRAIDDRFSWARCMAHLEHMDFSGVRELNMIYTPDFLHHILPRCRWLEKLWADVMVPNVFVRSEPTSSPPAAGHTKPSQNATDICRSTSQGGLSYVAREASPTDNARPVVKLWVNAGQS
ncbi:hypothetical protein BGZ73_001399 [Actinomortierella ambigua]|nr:hypothetical protein BGZ73_001390 [Actinomortierella ambigua]KAF9975076.1 hypothetical protein BGZ73_001399 [Actinomortierella ambigua]